MIDLLIVTGGLKGIIYPCDYIAGKKNMMLLKECRNELQLKTYCLNDNC